MQDVALKTYEEQRKMEKEHEDIYKSKKEVLVGVIDEVKPKGKNALYDILLKIGNKRYCIKFAYDCTYDKSLIEVGTHVGALCSRISDGVITASVIIPEDAEKLSQLYRFADAFNKKLGEEPESSELKEFEKKKAEKRKLMPVGFDKLPSDVKVSILDQMEGKKYEVNDSILTHELSSTEMKLKFQICKDTYPYETQMVIEDLLKGHQKKNNEKLQIILGINTRYHEEVITADEMLEKLNKALFGMNEAKQEVYSAIKTSARCGDNGLRILLVGHPGCGKTDLANHIALFRKKPYLFASCPSFTSLVDTSGDSSVYDASRAGFFAENFKRIGTTDSTVILDEIDKTNRDQVGKDGDPNECFLELLSGYHYDQFSQCKIDCHSTWFIATANDENDIKPHIKNRFDVIIHIDGYTDEDRKNIAESFIIPKLNKKWKIADNVCFITDKMMTYIISDFCFDYGCRDLKHNLERLYRKALDLDYDKKNKKFTKREIDKILAKDNIQFNPAAMCRINRKFFSEADQKIIEKIISETEMAKDSTGKKEVSVQRLQYIADIIKPRDVNNQFDYDVFCKAVDATHDGLGDLKNAFARTVNYYYRTKKAKNLLLIGPPGTGKTTLTKTVAEVSGLPYYKISCNGMNDPSSFKGTPPHTHSGCPGKIAIALSVVGTKAFIMLDEIDKINAHTEGGYACMSALLDLLDMKKFHDNYLDVDIDCSEVIFVATANNIENMTPELLDRFEVIHLDGYSKAEKKRIFKNNILPSVLDDCNCSKDEKISFEDSAIDFLIDNYTETAGARELRSNAEKIVGNILLGTTKNKVFVNDIIKHLGKPSIARGNRPTIYNAGTVNGLSVNSYSGLGNMFAIECVHSEHDAITGLAKDSLRESVEIAKAVATNINPNCKDKHYHIHFAEGAIPKDGPSAGVAITLAILSCEYDTVIDSKFAYTGEINLHGDVWAIGGEVAKIEAAAESGCSKVFIPYSNFMNMDDNKIDELSNKIEIVPISNITDVFKIAFDNEIVKKAL